MALGALLLCMPVAVSAAAPPAAAGTGAIAPVVVTADRLSVETLIDRKVYTISADLQSAVGTVADVLTAIPSVEVDGDGNVSLRGDSNVTILIDGRPAAQLSGASAADNLLQIPAQDIEKIEVITNPPAQFKADGTAGIINIIMRKRRRAGSSGMAQASAGNRERALFGASGNYNAGSLGFSGGVSLRQDDRRRIVESSLAAPDPVSGALLRSDHNLDEHVRRWIPVAKAGVDYAPNDRQSLELTATRGERSGNRFFDQHDTSSLAPGVPTTIADRHSAGREWSIDTSQRLVFQQTLGRPGETLSLMIGRSAFHEREHYDYTNSYPLPPAPPSGDDLNLAEDLVTRELSADLVLPLGGDRSLKLGYDLEQDDNGYDNSGDNVDPVTGALVVNPGLTNQFRYAQQVHAAYGSYQARAGAWTWQGGLRLERTRVDALEVTDSIANDRTDLRAYPSLHLDRSLPGGATLSFSASRRVSRPDPGALNPYTDHQDTQNLRAGNPALLPQDTQSYEVGYSVEAKGLAYGLTGYFRRDRNRVTDVTRALGGGVVLTTKANLPRSRSGGIEFTANGHLTSTLAFGLSGNAFYNEIDGTALGAPGLESTTGVNAKANLDYRPTSAATAQLSATRSDKRLTPQGFVDAINILNLGYKQQLEPRLAAVATVSDLFSGQRFRRHAASPSLTDVYERHVLGRVAYVGLLYAFGSQKKSKPGGFDYEE